MRQVVAGSAGSANGPGVSGDLRFAVLGPLRAWRAEAEIDIGSPQQGAALAALLLSDGRPVAVGQLVDAVWGEDPPRAAVSTLRTYISRLRRVLGSQVLESVGQGYALRVDRDTFDLTVFERRMAEAEEQRRAGGPLRALDTVREALGLWQGLPLSGLPGPLAELQRSRLSELRLAALGTRLDLDLEAGRHAEAAAELTALTAEHPLRERFREQLMLALYRSGRQAEALAVFQDTRRVLNEELGIEPGTGLQELQQRILVADPALARAAAGSVSAVDVPVPAQLPADLADFTGRDGLVGELRAMLRAHDQAVPVAAVAGLGGVGKTSLAVHVAHVLRDDFPDGQVYVQLRGMSDEPADPVQVLGAMLTSFGISEGTQPDGLSDRAALFRSVLAGRRVLLVLDDAQDAAQVCPLLPGTSGSAVLVTSRRRMPHISAARWIDLAVLSSDDAVALLAGVVGAGRIGQEPQAARDLVAACGFLPLAIRIIGSRIAARPHWPLSAVVTRLADDRRRLTELQADGIAVDATFELGYRQLDRRQARLFRLLSLPDGRGISLPAAAALAGLDEPETERVLESLVDLHLVESAGVAQYGYHDLLRVFARQRADEIDDVADRHAALDQLLDFYLASARNALRMTERGSAAPADTMPTVADGAAFADLTAARSWLLAEHPQIVALATQLATNGTTAVDQLADLLLMMMRLSAYGIDSGRLDHAAGMVAELARSQDKPRAEARARFLRGRLLTDRHRFDEAIPVLEHAAELARDAGDHRIRERALTRIGIAHYHHRRLAVTAPYFEDALVLAQRLDDRQRIAITMANLARLRRHQGDLPRALELAGHSRKVAATSGDGMALMYTAYVSGRILLAAGRPGESLVLVEGGLAQAGRLGFRWWAGKHHVLLAAVHRGLDRLGTGVLHAEQAIGIGRSIGDRAIECLGLVELGQALGDLRQPDRAAAAWREARALSAQLPPCCAAEVASRLESLGA